VAILDGDFEYLPRDVWCQGHFTCQNVIF
jgi:hypothetical protein